MWIKSVVAALVAVVLIGYVAREIPSTIHVERTLNAPVEKVWSAFTSAEAMKTWWGPANFTAPMIVSDFRVGGKFLLSMKSERGELFWNAGHFIEITEREKIVMMMSFSNEKGEILRGAEIPVPGTWPDEIQLTVTFTMQDESLTKLTIEEPGIPAIMYFMAKLGWQQQLDKLALSLN